MIINIIKGKLTAENLKKIGEMIEDGYTRGIDQPLGMNWVLLEDFHLSVPTTKVKLDKK